MKLRTGRKRFHQLFRRLFQRTHIMSHSVNSGCKLVSFLQEDALTLAKPIMKTLAHASLTNRPQSPRDLGAGKRSLPKLIGAIRDHYLIIIGLIRGTRLGTLDLKIVGDAEGARLLPPAATAVFTDGAPSLLPEYGCLRKLGVLLVGVLMRTAL